MGPRAVTAFAERLVRYASPGGAPEELRRARLLVWFMLLLQTQAALFAVLYAMLRLPLLSAQLAVVGAMLPLALVAARRRSLNAGAVVQLALMNAILGSVTWYTGGIDAPALPWVAATPVMATLLGGRRHGLAWLAVLVVNVAMVTACHRAGIQPPSPLTTDEVDVLLPTAVVMLAVVLLGFALIYEAGRDAMQRERDAAAAGMRRVLDSVGQGFFVAGADGVPSAARSAILDAWLGPAPVGAPWWDWLAPRYPRFAGHLALAWEAVFEDVLPLELNLAQLPQRLRENDAAFEVRYRPVLDDAGRVRELVVVIDDVRAAVAADAAERAQTERAAVLTRMVADRRGYATFRHEVDALLADLEHGASAPLRALHTLKGITGFWGMTEAAAVAHALESTLIDAQRPATAAELARLRDAIASAGRLADRAATADADRVEVTRRDVRALEHAIARRRDHATLAAMLASWHCEPTAVTFARLGEQARALADRLGKGPIAVAIEDHGVRLDPAEWGPVWASMVHALRNAIDHGVDATDERADRGKPAQPTLRLVSRVDHLDLVIELADDGRGVDWERVRERAIALGLPHATPADLEAALLHDGLSTRAEADELSGRGVGLAALAAAAHDVGAEVSIASTPGHGTTVRLRTARTERVRVCAATVPPPTVPPPTVPPPTVPPPTVPPRVSPTSPPVAA